MSERLRCFLSVFFFCFFVFAIQGAELEAAANVPKLIKIEINIGPLAKSIKQSQPARPAFPFHF